MDQQLGQVQSVGSPLCLARFAGQDDPTVIIGLTTAGAHCCTVMRAIPTAAPSRTHVDLDGNNPPSWVRADGDKAIVVTTDLDFAHKFTSYAASGLPVSCLIRCEALLRSHTPISHRALKPRRAKLSSSSSGTWSRR